MASLANSPDVAFRAEFPDGKVPRADALYWRGVVLWSGDGMEWRASEGAAIPRLPPRPAGDGVRQWITLEPHGAHWMFALDWPVGAPSGAILAPGQYLRSTQLIRKPRRYEVRSFARVSEKELRPNERHLLLAVPQSISPRVQGLAQSWATVNPDPRAIVSSALHFFGSQGFRYSLSPGQYRKNDLEAFLFERRLGFCEHYASSFATLMRLAGVPARVVLGYLGGEYNEFGRFFLVRQSDTHAWCEVWLPDSGWARVDPTSVVAPDRVNLGLDSFLDRRGSSEQTQNRTFAGNLARQPIFTELRLAWQTLNYAWDTRVLSFDADAQETFITDIDLGNVPPLQLIVGTLMSAVAAVALLGAAKRFRERARGDRVKALYERFCRIAARRGASRQPWEGPSHFARRAAALLPAESDRIRSVADSYVALRYSANASPALLEEFATKVAQFAATKRRRGSGSPRSRAIH